MYVFTLPFFRFLQGWLATALLLIAVATLAVYAAILIYELNLDLEHLLYRVGRAIKTHLLLLLAAFLLLLAVHHVLDLLELVHSTRGATYGAGYTDVHAQVPAQWALVGLALVATALTVATIFARSFRFLLIGLGGWAVGALVLGTLYPNFVQSVDVRPNELARETPYIEANIQGTLRAYGLAAVQEQFFAAEEAVTVSEIRANPQTVENLRLWDDRPLLPTYNQIQSIRPYYEFPAVDVDRYRVNGQYRQVMLGVRELIQSKLPAQAQTWVNQKLTYTHGYGVAMNPVNAVGSEGLPQFFIKDVPPVGEIPIRRPEVYYGERDRSSQYVVVRTSAAGVRLSARRRQCPDGLPGSQWRGAELAVAAPRLRLAVPRWQPAAEHGSAPGFPAPVPPQRARARDDDRALLGLDSDPYIVVTEGRLVWLLDAYTVSNRYPYAQPYSRPRRAGGSTTSATASRSPSTPTTALRRFTWPTPRTP